MSQATCRDDVVLRALDRRVPRTAAVRTTSSQARLAGAAGKLPLVLALSATGFAFNSAISYWAAAVHEGAQCALDPVVRPAVRAALVAGFVRRAAEALAQFAGIILSLSGVLVIILRGDLAALAAIHFNRQRPDVRRRGTLFRPLFGADAVPAEDAPRSLITFTIGCGAVLLLPFSLWEFFNGITLKPDALTVATLLYVMIFPSPFPTSSSTAASR